MKWKTWKKLTATLLTAGLLVGLAACAPQGIGVQRPAAGHKHPGGDHACAGGYPGACGGPAAGGLPLQDHHLDCPRCGRRHH